MAGKEEGGVDALLANLQGEAGSIRAFSDLRTNCVLGTHTSMRVLHAVSTQRATGGFLAEFKRCSVTISVGKPLCPHGIAYRRVYVFPNCLP